MVPTKGHSQRVDLEALRLKVLLLGGAPGAVLLVTPDFQYTKGFVLPGTPYLQCTKCSVPPHPRQGLFSNYFHLTQKKLKVTENQALNSTEARRCNQTSQLALHLLPT